MTTNELQLAKAFRDAGFPQDKAEAVSETIFAAIRDNVATKADLSGAETALRSDLQVLGAELRREIEAARSDLLFKMTGVQIAIGGLLFAALKLVH